MIINRKIYCSNKKKFKQKADVNTNIHVSPKNWPLGDVNNTYNYAFLLLLTPYLFSKECRTNILRSSLIQTSADSTTPIEPP